jgi:hypothetical protein
MTAELVHELTKAVQDSFKSGVPNGIALGWDRGRLFCKFKKRFSNFTVFNDTDFNYSFCNRFEIELLNEGKTSYTVTARFSFIAPVYSVHATQYCSSKSIGHVISESEDSTVLLLTREVCEFAKSEGFVRFKSEMSSIIVEGVTLELSEYATLGKCLFEDYE